jgi:hypothetical protein
MNNFISIRMLFSKFSILIVFCLIFSGICHANKPVLKLSANDVSCFDKKDGKILIDLTNINKESFRIIVLDSMSDTLASYNDPNKTSFQLGNLAGGSYKVMLFANSAQQEYRVKINSPGQLRSNIITIKEIKGKDPAISAALEANPSGGNPPYLIEWSDNTGKQTGKIAKDLPKGIYRCIINDSKGCGPISATFFLYDEEIKKFNNKK